jgi:hypothetical protein
MRYKFESEKSKSVKSHQMTEAFFRGKTVYFLKLPGFLELLDFLLSFTVYKTHVLYFKSRARVHYSNFAP